jgi:hypothetical protein
VIHDEKIARSMHTHPMPQNSGKAYPKNTESLLLNSFAVSLSIMSVELGSLFVSFMILIK